MKNLSGLVLDVYDDTSGAILKELFSSSTELPEITKQAHALSVEERDVLPDQAFALILVDKGVELKKFATVDSCNTALSVAYFIKTAHKLPLEAQSVAANNLWAACEHYGLEAPEELKKLAMGLGSMLSSALIIPNQAREAKNNLAATKGSGGMVMTPDQVKQTKTMQGLT